MAQSPNQFVQNPEKGQLDLKVSESCLSVIADSVLVPGQAVKLVNSVSGIPHVTAITAATDVVFGFVPYEVRRVSYAIGDRFEVAFYGGNIMYLEANAAVSRGDNLMPVIAGNRVATATTGNRIIGFALDPASGAGVMFRALINLPGQLA